MNGCAMHDVPVVVADERAAPDEPVNATLPAGRRAEEAAPLAIGNGRVAVGLNTADHGATVNPLASRGKVVRRS